LAYTLVSGQLFGSDALTGALAVEMQTAPYPVGVHSIVQGTLTAGSNYLINFTKGTLTVTVSGSDVFDIIINNKSADRRDGLFYGDPAENGEDHATVYVLANPGETISIDGVLQNPRTVALPDYGENSFTVTVTAQNGTSNNYTLIIERYYDLVYFEYADVENGEDHATVYVLANPGETISIDGVLQNPRTVALPDYGENSFTVTVTAQNGTSNNYTLIIERYYDLVYFEYPDVPTISCNPLTNGGFNFTGFQWYQGDNVIPGATGPYIQVKDNAFYHCELTPNIGNSMKLRTINVRSLSLRASGGLTAYPNPTQGKVTVQWNMNGDSTPNVSSGRQGIQVFDANGALVLQPATNPFDMSALPQGMYFIKVNGESVKVIKTN